MSDTPDDLRTIRMLRSALSGIWTALETDEGDDIDQAIYEAQTIADEGLKMSVRYCRRGKDLTDDSRGLESWRIHVTPEGEIIKEFW